MAQALLNNLSTMTDGIYTGNSSAIQDGIALGEDFTKILDTKTIDTATAETTTENMDSSTASVNKTIEDNTETISTIIQTVIQEAEAEAAVDLNLVEEFSVKTDDTNSENTETDNTIADETPTIIEEDPTTMYKEQITLENPNAVLLLQTQISTNDYKIADKNTDDTNQDGEDSVITFKQTGNASLHKKEQSNTLFAEKAAKYAETITRESSKTAKSEDNNIKNIISEDKIKDLNIESIESGASKNDTNSENLMQKQTPQEQAFKAMIQGDIKYSQIESGIQTTVKPAVSTSDITPSRIVEQITKQLEGMFNGSKVNIVLNPESLGKVSLNIINTRGGLQAQFTVSTQEAHDLIMKGLNGLKDGLIAHGISVDNVSVKLEKTGDSEHQFDWTEQEGSRGGNKEQNAKRQKEDEKQFEQMMFEFSENGNV